jgi:hypothetical protein
VLREALSLGERTVRLETLLILFWRVVWGGEEESGSNSGGGQGKVSLLYSGELMDLMQANILNRQRPSARTLLGEA